MLVCYNLASTPPPGRETLAKNRILPRVEAANDGQHNTVLSEYCLEVEPEHCLHIIGPEQLFSKPIGIIGSDCYLCFRGGSCLPVIISLVGDELGFNFGVGEIPPLS